MNAETNDNEKAIMLMARAAWDFDETGYDFDTFEKTMTAPRIVLDHDQLRSSKEVCIAEATFILGRLQTTFYVELSRSDEDRAVEIIIDALWNGFELDQRYTDATVRTAARQILKKKIVDGMIKDLAAAGYAIGSFR